MSRARVVCLRALETGLQRSARRARSVMVEQLAIVGNGEGTTCSVLYRSHGMIARFDNLVIYIVDWRRIRGRISLYRH